MVGTSPPSSQRTLRARLLLWVEFKLARLDLLLARDDGRPSFDFRADMESGGASVLSAPKLALLALFRTAWEDERREGDVRDGGAANRGLFVGSAGPEWKRRPARLVAARGDSKIASTICAAETASFPPVSPAKMVLSENGPSNNCYTQLELKHIRKKKKDTQRLGSVTETTEKMKRN
jgi:hypothetical protein